jgi:hypothetical protein
MIAQGVVITVEWLHVSCHGARNNLSRHEKMPQIRLFGEFLQHNADHFDRVDRAILRPKPSS